jgi:hypothetical protein
MDISEPYTTHNSSPGMSSSEADTEWDQPEPSAPVSNAAPQPNPLAGFIFPGQHSLSTANSSSSSLHPLIIAPSKRKQGQSSNSKGSGKSGYTKMTPKMKDRQARGKEWDMSTTDDDDESDAPFKRHYLNP